MQMHETTRNNSLSVVNIQTYLILVGFGNMPDQF